MAKLKELKKGEELNENNVEKYIQKAIDKYFETGFLIDGFFWRKAMQVLEDKHKIKIL